MAAGTFLNIAHRGARAFAPENTVPAIRLARETGANVVELDVQITRDGELVVFHDDDLRECSDAIQRFPARREYTIGAWTVEDVVRLDVGAAYLRQLSLPAGQRRPYLQSLAAGEMDRWIGREDVDLYGSGSVRIPTLREALERARQCGLAVILDIKNLPRRDSRIGRTALALVHDLGMAPQTLLTSFDHELLAEIRREDERIATGVLTSERLHDIRDYVDRLGADAFEPERAVADLSTIRDLTAAGLLVNVWTENDEAGMRELVESGASGIFSDYPNRLSSVLAAAGRSAAADPLFERRLPPR